MFCFLTIRPCLRSFTVLVMISLFFTGVELVRASFYFSAFMPSII